MLGVLGNCDHLPTSLAHGECGQGTGSAEDNAVSVIQQLHSPLQSGDPMDTPLHARPGSDWEVALKMGGEHLITWLVALGKPETPFTNQTTPQLTARCTCSSQDQDRFVLLLAHAQLSARRASQCTSVPPCWGCGQAGTALTTQRLSCRASGLSCKLNFGYYASVPDSRPARREGTAQHT